MYARPATRTSGSWWRAGGSLTRTPTPGGGTAQLPQAAIHGDRELQRAFQGPLRHIRAGVTRGEADTARLALGAVFVYRLALVLRHEQILATNRGMKAFLGAA